MGGRHGQPECCSEVLGGEGGREMGAEIAGQDRSGR